MTDLDFSAFLAQPPEYLGIQTWVVQIDVDQFSRSGMDLRVCTSDEFSSAEAAPVELLSGEAG